MNEMKIAVVIASLGRPDAIADLLELLDARNLASRIILCFR